VREEGEDGRGWSEEDGGEMDVKVKVKVEVDVK
jgi:hypothetical protein